MRKLCLLLLIFHSSLFATPVRVLVNDWSSQQILANIAEQVFIRLGYEVEFINVEVDAQWYLLKSNKADLQLEVWQGTMEEKYTQLLNSGGLVDLGTYSVATREDWWYPMYVKDACPGLPDWRALRKCHDIFVRSDSRGKGVYVAGPWEKPDRARIKALGLNFVVKQVEDDQALWRELANATAQQQAILIFNWTPNWVGSVYSGEFVEFPVHSKACEEDAKWGINAELPYDCGNPRSGWLKKVSSNRFVELFPCLANGLRQFDLTNDEIESLSAKVDVEKQTPKQVAQSWVIENRARWHAIFNTCKQ
ncbi:ABC transporter substrate-binding protein [Pseudoalteromonas luteoviolacea]|uniref:ABC transporter substrate-binding protein n=1 Tax=Pseudoalteromonas luteoviolacea TaxID=43657 RepID=UPI001B3675E7|nr:ABC transporter substrate-binding protein [Pseudoalteromonas luteoviolacea]MBQ4835887.1 ABC transporter substrate-binding protein [Pseudoalteromonas luteoviolacea]